ncbi:MAG: uroporphyrinogen decarboxylase [candidate division KSB1 bacterium]|nr:uroporphyrinogen decarboxylase [candidate division KSB1 bacterium]
MTEEQWRLLLDVVSGRPVSPLPVAFIIDSPWLPNWYGIQILDYFTSEELWFQANLQAVRQFPQVLFLPGFWAEYGMCTEPSAFGVRCVFPPNEFPQVHKLLRSIEEAAELPQPDPRTDGLLPFVLNRLKHARPRIEEAGHQIRFAVARGPLNIAAHLLGTTEFLTAMMLEPEKTESLLHKITSFLRDWLELQMETFPTIDGVFLLDDMIGFIGPREFERFGFPFFKRLFDYPVSVRFLHNDADCRASAPYLPDMGVNLFNMGFEVSLNDLKQMTRNEVALMGNIPPRDVLAAGTPDTVRAAVQELIASLSDRRRILLSCGGGMPPGVRTENLVAFLEGAWGQQGAGL